MQLIAQHLRVARVRFAELKTNMRPLEKSAALHAFREDSNTSAHPPLHASRARPAMQYWSKLAQLFCDFAELLPWLSVTSRHRPGACKLAATRQAPAVCSSLERMLGFGALPTPAGLHLCCGVSRAATAVPYYEVPTRVRCG